MTKDLVTVAVPVYNHEDYIVNALESIKAQDYPSIEIVVVNDGSTDNTDARVREFIEANKDSDINYMVKENGGVASAMAAALSEARGEYFCELCSDDELTKGSITKRFEYLQAHSELDGVLSNAYAMVGTDKTTDKIVGAENNGKDCHITSRHSFEDFLENKTTIVLHTGLFKTDRLKALGGYDTDFFTEDVFLRLLIARYGNVGFLDEAVLYYRSHDTNISKGKPLWMRKEKILSFEKLIDREKDEPTKNLLYNYLYKEYLRFIREGLKQKAHKPEIGAELKDALAKALEIKPLGLKAWAYKFKI